MRIFLDANVLFSAAKSAGAMRALIEDLLAGAHVLVADQYVSIEARRNLAIKANTAALDVLDALLARMEVSPVQFPESSPQAVGWLPEHDRPVLSAAIALDCDALVTGDRTHFGAGYGKTFDGVTVCSPVQLAQVALPARGAKLDKRRPDS